MRDEIRFTISRIVEKTPARDRFGSSSERWNKLFPALSRYFGTLREVRSFGNGLSFHLELYANGDSFDANPVDVIALEALRQFEPSLYEKLYQSKALLTPLAHLSFDSPVDNKKQVEALLESAHKRDSATAIIEDLFPPAAWALGELKERERGRQDEWLRNLRACHWDVFDRYFRFGLSANDLPTSEFDSILNAGSDQKSLAAKLSDLAQEGLLVSTFTVLRANVESIPREIHAPFVAGVMDAERVLIVQPQQQNEPIEMQALWLVDSMLRTHTADERGRMLREAIAGSDALYLSLMSFEPSEEEIKKTNDPLVSSQFAEDLKELCLQKIRAAAADARLLAHPRLRYILSYWLRWGSSDEAPGWVQQFLASDASLLAMLLAFVDPMSEINEDGVKLRTRYRFGLAEFSRYAEPDGLIGQVRDLAAPTSGDQKLVCQLFIHAFDRWKSAGRHISDHRFSEWTRLEDLP